MPPAACAGSSSGSWRPTTRWRRWPSWGRRWPGWKRAGAMRAACWCRHSCGWGGWSRRLPRWNVWWRPTRRAPTTAACWPACWAAPSSGSGPSPRRTRPPPSRRIPRRCRPRGYNCACRPDASPRPPPLRARPPPCRASIPAKRIGGCWRIHAMATPPRRPALPWPWTGLACRTRAWRQWPCARCSMTTGSRRRSCWAMRLWTRDMTRRRCALRWGWRTCAAPPRTTASSMPWRISRRA